MTVKINGGVILITGASSGIGRALSIEVATRARGLVLVARRENRLNTLKQEVLQLNPSLDVLVVPTDLADAQATQAMCEQVLAH